MNRLFYRILSGGSGARLELVILTRQTAGAFGVPAPKTAGLSTPELLRAYARFTADAAMCAAEGGQDAEQLHQALYRMAYGLGSRLRRWLRPRDRGECLALVALLYRNIGIQLSEEAPGIFCVQKCYFSEFYTPEVCSVISAIDQGIFAGIYQGGTLTFRTRITQGQAACRADLLPEE